MSSFRWAPLILLITFVIALPVGWGSVTYILVAELVPTQIRTETAVLCDAWGQLLQVTHDIITTPLHTFVCLFTPEYSTFKTREEAYFLVLQPKAGVKESSNNITKIDFLKKIKHDKSLNFIK